MEPALRLTCDAAKHVSQPGQRIDIIEFRRHDQRGHGSGPIGAAFGAGEEPRFSSQRKTSQRPLGGIVAKADAAIVKKASKAIPALEQIVSTAE